MSSKLQSPGLQGYSLNIFGRFSCTYPMAYKGNLTNSRLNLSVEIFICQSFRCYNLRFLLHNSFSEFQWLIATLIVDRCQSNWGRDKREGMWVTFKQPLAREGALRDEPKQQLQRLPRT